MAVVQANASVGGDVSSCTGASAGFHGRAALKTVLAVILKGAPCAFRIEGADSVVIRARRTPSALSPTAPPSRQSSQASSGSPAVVVTGGRRQKDAWTAAITSTFWTAERLQNSGAHTLADMAPFVAGMETTNLGPGRDKVLLRGLSDGVFPGEASSTVALYLDGLRLNYTERDPNLRLVDVSSIEVLRGPQGGETASGAIGGVIAMQSNAPRLDDFSGLASISVDAPGRGGGGGGFDAVLNVPVVKDVSALRAVVYGQSDGGYVSDPLRQRRDTNSSVENGVRVSGLVRLGADWELTGGMFWQALHVADSQYVYQPVTAFDRENELAEPSRNDSAYLYARITGPLGPTRLTWLEAVSDHEVSARYDATDSLSVFGLSQTVPAAYDDDRRVRTLLSDVVLQSQLDPAPWRLGLSVIEVKDTDDADLGLINAPSQPLYANTRKDSRSDISLYGAIRWPILPTLALDLSATGYWFSHHVRSVASRLDDLEVGAPFLGNHDDRGISPVAALDFNPFEGLVMFVRLSSGARPAGFNTGVLLAKRPTGVSPYEVDRAYSGDTTTDVEIGEKYASPDGLFSFETSAYLIHWKRIQTDEFSIYNTPLTVNLGDGDISGIELQGALHPTKTLEISETTQFESATLSKATSTSYFTGSYGGILGTPRYSGGVMVAQRFPAQTWEGRLSMQAGFVGPSKVTFDGLTASSLKGYSLVNFTSEIRFGDWRTAFLLANAFDRTDDTLAFGNPFSFDRGRQITPLRPRHVTLTLTRSF